MKILILDFQFRYGGKRVFLTGIGATASLTILTPILTKTGTGFLISTRILEGLFEVRSSSLYYFSINFLYYIQVVSMIYKHQFAKVLLLFHKCNGTIVFT